jgi:hypothetical protein
MEKEKVLFFLNHFREQRKPVDHVAEAERGASYSARAAKVAQAEAPRSPEQQALEIAFDAINALPEDFKLSTGQRLFEK